MSLTLAPFSGTIWGLVEFHTQPTISFSPTPGKGDDVTKTQKEVWKVEWLLHGDLNDMLMIDTDNERDRPWWKGWFVDDFTAHLSRRDTIGCCVRWGDECLGYAIYRLEPERIELVRLAVQPDFHRQGIGAALVAKLANKLSHDRRKSLQLWVPEHALSAQLFLKACDFQGFPIGDGKIRFIRFQGA